MRARTLGLIIAGVLLVGAAGPALASGQASPVRPHAAGTVVGAGTLARNGSTAAASAGFVLNVVDGHGTLTVRAPWPSGRALGLTGTITSATVGTGLDTLVGRCAVSLAGAGAPSVPCEVSLTRRVPVRLVVLAGGERFAGVLRSGHVRSLARLDATVSSPVVLSCPALPYPITPTPYPTVPPVSSGAPSSVPLATQTGPTLRSLAAGKDLLVGTGLPGWEIWAADAYQRSIPATQFNMVTSTNQTDWADPEGAAQNVYDYCDADQFVGLAQANNLAFSWEQLLAGTITSQDPNWLSGLSAAQLLQAMRDYITTTMHTFGSQVALWDVVNEAIEPNGQPYPNIFEKEIGYPAYVEDAFAFAHEADPSAKLMYSDYWFPGWTAKQDAVIALVQDLQNAGLTINQVGIELNGAPYNPGYTESQIQGVLDALAQTGVNVAITQMTVPLYASNGLNSEGYLRDNPAYALQASAYGNALAACVATPACHYFMLWGFSSSYGVANDVYDEAFGVNAQHSAGIYSRYYQPKPAYYALRADLSVPAAPVLSATAGNSEVSLSWTTPNDGASPITGYELYRGSSPGDLTAYQSLPVENSFTDTAVTDGTTYVYAVAAENSYGTGRQSNEVSATPTDPQPAVPSAGPAGPTPPAGPNGPPGPPAGGPPPAGGSPGTGPSAVRGVGSVTLR